MSEWNGPRILAPDVAMTTVPVRPSVGGRQRLSQVSAIKGGGLVDFSAYAGITIGWTYFVLACTRSTVSIDAEALSHISYVGPILIAGLLTGLCFRSSIRSAKKGYVVPISIGMLTIMMLFLSIAKGVWDSYQHVRLDTPDSIGVLALMAIFATIPTFQALKLADGWARGIAKKVKRA